MKEEKRLTIGILVSGIMDDVTIAMCQGVKQAAQGRNVDLVVLPGKYWERDLTDNRELMYEYQYNTIFSYARPETLDGIVVASRMDGYVSVTFQNEMGIDEGMKYLIKKVGHTHFGMLGGSSDNSDAQDRKAAFIRNKEVKK